MHPLTLLLRVQLNSFITHDKDKPENLQYFYLTTFPQKSWNKIHVHVEFIH